MRMEENVRASNGLDESHGDDPLGNLLVMRSRLRALEAEGDKLAERRRRLAGDIGLGVAIVLHGSVDLGLRCLSCQASPYTELPLKPARITIIESRKQVRFVGNP